MCLTGVAQTSHQLPSWWADAHRALYSVSACATALQKLPALTMHTRAAVAGPACRPGVLLRVSAAQGSNPWCPPSTSASSQHHAAHRSLHCLALDATSGIDAYEDPSSSSQPDQTQPTSRLGSALSTVAATLSELQRLALKSWDGERDAKGRKGQRPLKAEPEPFEAELDEDQYEDGEYEVRVCVCVCVCVCVRLSDV